MTVDQLHGQRFGDEVDPLNNPDLANQLVAEAMGDHKHARPTIIPDPPDDTVTLPGGLPTINGLVRTATVREMNGADEEELAKPSVMNDFVKQINLILGRCVLTIGDERADRSNLDELLIGDRDMLLQAIRVATYGDEMRLDSKCPYCQQVQTVIYTFSIDVPIREHDGREIKLADGKHAVTLDSNRRTYLIPLRKGGTAEVRLIDGGIQRSVYTPENADRSSAEINTLLLARCVQEIDDEPVTHDQVRNLSSADRRNILQFLNDSQPGPQWGEVEHTCDRCERPYPFIVDVLSMFRGI